MTSKQSNFEKHQNKEIIVVSLFSGCGGLDFGLKAQGLKIIWAIDNDSDCVSTYKKNIGNHIVEKSISDVASDEIPNCDVVIGGFPCQGFSLANKFRSKDDERNELYIEMLRVIKDKKPKWFIAENVKGILNLDGGRVFQKIIEDLQSIGYQTNYKLVNMADHGVPQTRKRVIILGTRNDLPSQCKIEYPLPKYAENDSQLKKWITIDEALDELKNLKPKTNLVGSKYKVQYKNYTGHRKTRGDKPCPTIIARGNGKGGVCAIPHPNGERRLNVRESAFIQTFPHDFEFIGSLGSMYRQVGNAVPILYARELAIKLIEANNKLIENKLNFQQKKAPKVVSLFSGAGGMDLGFVKAGFKVIWAIDNFDDAVETYRKNISEDIIYSSIEEYNLDAIPNSDVVIGGFPCQGFSVANINRNLNDKRNILYKYFVQIVKLKQPKFFIAENVKGILSLGKGKIFKTIMEEFGQCGYRCQYSVFNAADYGVPQTRERVFVLGIRNDIKCDVEFPPKPTHRDSHISIGNALSIIPDPDKAHDLKNHKCSKFKLKFNGYIGNRKINPDLPSPTITARGDSKGGAVILHHPSNTRRLTCREAAYIQGFPLNFEFIGSMTSVYRQIGNAVPYPLAHAIASTIYNAIVENSSTTSTQNIQLQAI
jgi:DNA (cytosine-5)-methyltransferase 1